ncbi:MAG: hypothetical protein U1F83_05395 [Verrucomicrobiota bacterium]
MKSRPLIWLSLGLNLILLAAVCHFALRRPASRPVPREVRMIPVSEPVTDTTTETNSESAMTDPGVEAFSWAQLTSTDFKVYRDRLRAIGCPEETVRDIIIAEINEKFRPRRAEIVTSVQGRYWEITAKGKNALKEWETALEKLDEERQALINDVLGKNPADEQTNNEQQTRWWTNRYAWLPAEKQGRLVELEQESQKRTQAIWEEIRKRPNTQPTAEDNQKFKALQDELTTARQQLLSPEEYLEYRLRGSSAGSWAGNLQGFETTETEWRAVARLKLDYEDALKQAFPETDEVAGAFANRYGTPLPPPDASEASAQEEVRRQMQAELEAAMKSTLGAERFAEYELASNSDYQRTKRIIERYQLSETLAKRAYELQHTAAAHARATRADANLSDEARASALAAIRQETERALATTLGAKVFNTYQEYHGDWLKQLDQVPEKQP